MTADVLEHVADALTGLDTRLATTPTCVLCGATARLRLLNEPALLTPSQAPDYWACDDERNCVERAVEASRQAYAAAPVPDDDKPETDCA